MRFGTSHLALSGICGVLVGSIFSGTLSAQQGITGGFAGVRQNFLLQEPLKQLPGKRIAVFTGEFQPGARTPLHRHPGSELLYVLEGEGEMIIPGQERRPLKAGNIVLVEPADGEDSFVHVAVNRSQTDVMKTLVLVIHDEGTPIAVPVNESSQ